MNDEYLFRLNLSKAIDDPDGTLHTIYDDTNPYPYFNQEKIGFRKLRNYNHQKWNVREPLELNRIIVWEDIEYQIPGEKFIWEGLGKLPCKPIDKLILSYKTDVDKNWPCEYSFSSWHMIKVCMNNKDTFVEHRTHRPFFSNILLGNVDKSMRHIFFNKLKENNQLESNLVSAFGEYRSSFLDEGNDEIDIFFKNIDKDRQTNRTNTTELFRGSFASQFVSKHIEENTWINVVAETLDTNRIFFPTEKIAKALISGKPFIVLSGKHFLKNLRDMGFKTFHPIIDESYDKEEDLHKRTNMAYESFTKLQKLDQNDVRFKLKEVLSHNEKLMRDKEFLTKNVRKMLEPLITEVEFRP